MFQLIRAMGPKGQVVFPKDIRDNFNLRTGSEVAFRVENNKIIVEPVDVEKFVKSFCDGSLRNMSMKEIKASLDEWRR